MKSTTALSFLRLIACVHTAVTAMVAPSAHAIAPAATFGTGGGVVASLETWRLALPATQ